jgi:WD40 repeat protein
VSRKIILGVVAVVSAAACVFLVVVLFRQGLAQAGAWAAPLSAFTGIVAAAAAVWALMPRPSKVPLPPELEVPDWAVDRPAELSAIVKALVGGRAGTVGITTGLYGAGGFGKTTLAQMVCADRQVRRRFGGRVYLVTVGRDVRGAAAIAAKVNDVIKLVTGENATFTDPQLAGRQLGSLLDAGPRRLLVLDDVWLPEQLAPLVEGGKRCARLVTTRVPELLARRGTAVQVDQMSPEQAQALLTSGLPPLDLAVVQGLLEVTGRWPLLLRLVNKILADYARVAADVSGQGAVLLARLRAGGPAVVDHLLGGTGRGLDVGQPAERALAVWATIGASTSLLDGDDADRFAELGIFAEDETIPFSLVTLLWRATAGLDDLQAAQVCRRLTQLALVSEAAGPVYGITLHDVVRDYLRAELGKQQLTELNGTLMDAVMGDLLVARPLDPAAAHQVPVPWWEMRREYRYLWDHLIEHLRDAGRPVDAEAVAVDLRWMGARLEQFGPAALAADLSAAGTPRAVRLRAVLIRTAHLLAPTEPAEAVVDVLHSRVADDPDWGPQAVALGDSCSRARLVNRWPLPDLADPALRRVLAGHVGKVGAVAIAPDGSWLASGGDDGTVRIWDAATGQERAALKGHTGGVQAVAIAPDGSWLASGGWDKTVRIWDAATGQERVTLKGHTHWVQAVAIAPDGSWLASGSSDGTVRIWDAATGQERVTLEAHASVEAMAIAPDGSWLASGGSGGSVRIWDAATGQERATLIDTSWVEGVAIAPDSSWLASGGWNGTVQIWDAATGQERVTLKGHSDRVEALAVAPDGSWLASSGDDGTVRIWDMATGQERPNLTGTSWVRAVAVAPDGTWLASGDRGWTVRIWDVATRQEVAALRSRGSHVNAVAIAPDGSWLASGGSDGTVQIWDVATRQELAALKADLAAPEADPIWVEAVAIAQDGSWLASGDWNGTVRIWDVATGQERATLTGHRRRVTAVTVSPDGSWLASGGWDGTVRIWDAATWRERATLTHAGWVEAVAIAPDGSWLASGGRDGIVRIWDAATGREQATLTGHSDEVRAVSIAPDGSRLASGGDDGTVRIWDVPARQVRALMRIDGAVYAFAWVGPNILAVGGSAGLYLFGFLTGPDQAATVH